MFPFSILYCHCHYCLPDIPRQTEHILLMLQRTRSSLETIMSCDYWSFQHAYFETCFFLLPHCFFFYYQTSAKWWITTESREMDASAKRKGCSGHKQRWGKALKALPLHSHSVIQEKGCDGKTYWHEDWRGLAELILTKGIFLQTKSISSVSTGWKNRASVVK